MARRRSKRNEPGPPNPKEETSLERIGGTSSSMPAWFLDKGSETTRTVGRVVVKNPAGQAIGLATGFLIPGGLLITCHHVIPSPAVAQTSAIQFDFRVASDGSFFPLAEFAFDPARFFATNKALDTTVVALTSPNPAGARVEARGSIALNHREDAILIGESVHVIHHPGGEPLSVSLDASVIKTFDDYILYAGDTAPGSAGAPVLNSNWELVGLHHSRVPRYDTDGRIISRDGTVWIESMGQDQVDWLAKEAIRSSSIKRWIDAVAVRVTSKKPRLPSPKIPRGSVTARPPSMPEARVVLQGGAADRPERDAVFVSYARADQNRVKWVDRLDVHLRQMPGLSTRVWNDSRIEAGVNWRKEIEYSLASAKAAVLLIGPNFLVSRFVLDNELPPLLKAAKEEGVRIFPLITDPSAYEESVLGQYQSFNDPKKCLSKLSGPEQNETLLALARAVAGVFQ